jgi:uncharacterized membrane protein
MKTFLHFIKATITGGVLFLIPLVLIVIVIGKAFKLLRPLVESGAGRLQVETSLGVAILTLLTSVALCVICFTAGLLIRFDKMKRINKFTEELILKFVPGFEYLKAVAGQQLGGETGNTLTAVLLRDQDAWVIAFLVEESPHGYTTVFIPEAPRADSGNSKILLTASLCYHRLSMREAMNCLRHYGAGMVSLLDRKGTLQGSQASGRTL